MADDVVERFLASLDPWPVDQRIADDPGETPSGDAWLDAADALGVPCPPELFALGEAQAERRIWVGPWELITPEGARSRAQIDAFAAEAPCLAPLRDMLPLFSADGDLLLLAPDGRIRRWSVASGAPYDDHRPVAASLADLLEAFTNNERRPFLWSAFDRPQDEDEDEGDTDAAAATIDPTEAAGWIDGLEYTWRIDHTHARRDGAWTCITALVGDLAPHYLRYPDGPDAPSLTGHQVRGRAPFRVEFAGDPAIVPREVPVGVIAIDDHRVDLLAVAPRLVRAALAAGWTGRDGTPRVLDGWATLGLPHPPPAR